MNSNALLSTLHLSAFSISLWAAVNHNLTECGNVYTAFDRIYLALSGVSNLAN